jgi:hypothetical protein
MPTERLPRYPLWRKLGIREGGALALVGAPLGFEVPDLPAGVTVRHSASGPADLTVWFVPSRAILERRIAAMAPRARSSGLWIAWPKRTSPLATDLSDEIVRRTAIASGLVDFKVCAIDSDWSGLRFNLRSHDVGDKPEKGDSGDRIRDRRGGGITPPR